MCCNLNSNGSATLCVHFERDAFRFDLIFWLHLMRPGRVKTFRTNTIAVPRFLPKSFEIYTCWEIDFKNVASYRDSMSFADVPKSDQIVCPESMIFDLERNLFRFLSIKMDTGQKHAPAIGLTIFEIQWRLPKHDTGQRNNRFDSCPTTAHRM